MKHRKYPTITAFVLALALAQIAPASVFNMPDPYESLDFVIVGDPGNVNDGFGHGGVDYEYLIGKYEVTNAQYTEFLKSVATVGDVNELYVPSDQDEIIRTGSGTQAQPWTYSVGQGWGNRPVHSVTWYTTLRFANWLHNGQPTGGQTNATTEDGAYTLTGKYAVADGDHPLHGPNGRNAAATIWVPSHDEWYKPAYYKGEGTEHEDYWDYPTQSNDPPTPEPPPGTDMVNGSANYCNAVGDTTPVGAYDAKPSDSPYGTFDQGGNLWEGTEALIDATSERVVRGGSYSSSGCAYYLHRASPYSFDPTIEFDDVGFRVAAVPEPATLSLLALGGLGLIRRRRS